MKMRCKALDEDAVQSPIHPHRCEGADIVGTGGAWLSSHSSAVPRGGAVPFVIEELYRST